MIDFFDLLRYNFNVILCFRISLPTQRNARKETCQGDNGFEFCLRKILHTFSPLESPFGRPRHPERSPAESPSRYTRRGYAVRFRFATLRMTRRDAVEPAGRCHLWHRDLGFAVRFRFASLRMTRRDAVEPVGRCRLWHRDLAKRHLLNHHFRTYVIL